MGEDGHGLANRPVGVPKVVALDSSALQVCWTLNCSRAWLLHTIFLANQTLSRSIESFLLVFLLLVSDLRPAYEKVVPGAAVLKHFPPPPNEPTCGRDTTSAVCIVSGVVFVRIFAYRPDTFTS